MEAAATANSPAETAYNGHCWSIHFAQDSLGRHDKWSSLYMVTLLNNMRIEMRHILC